MIPDAAGRPGDYLRPGIIEGTIRTMVPEMVHQYDYDV